MNVCEICGNEIFIQVESTDVLGKAIKESEWGHKVECPDYKKPIQ